MQRLIELVEQGMALAGSGDRTDLRRRLEQTKRRLLDPSIRVIVVGEFKQGKSQLVNALVNAPVCPVDDDVATAVPTVVRHADTVQVALVREVPDGPPERTEVPVDKLAQYVSEAGNPGNKAKLSYAE